MEKTQIKTRECPVCGDDLSMFDTYLDMIESGDHDLCVSEYAERSAARELKLANPLNLCNRCDAFPMARGQEFANTPGLCVECLEDDKQAEGTVPA